MSSLSARLFVVFVCAVFALLLTWLVRRRVHYTVLEANNEFAGFMYSMIGLVYGVYLAFTIIAVWEQFSAAEEVTTAEATHLSELWRDAQVLSPEDRTAIQQQLQSYTDSVIRDEWPTMAQRLGAASRTSAIYEDLWRRYYDVRLEGASAVQHAFYQEMIRRLNDLGLLRRRRLQAANSELPPLMWVLLVTGGIVTVLFSLLFGTRHGWMQYTVVGVIAGGDVQRPARRRDAVPILRRRQHRPRGLRVGAGRDEGPGRRVGAPVASAIGPPAPRARWRARAGSPGSVRSSGSAHSASHARAPRAGWRRASSGR